MAQNPDNQPSNQRDQTQRPGNDADFRGSARDDQSITKRTGNQGQQPDKAMRTDSARQPDSQPKSKGQCDTGGCACGE